MLHLYDLIVRSVLEFWKKVFLARFMGFLEEGILGSFCGIFEELSEAFLD